MASGGQLDQETPESGHYRLKILIPSVAAGAIIGKGGETIAQLQKDTSTRIIMSKVRDFYPGTNERVCLITGNVDGILLCLEFIIEKFKEKPDFNAKAGGTNRKMPVEREKQVKILVPNSTASMIIGERGNYIKQIKKDSGAMVQISQKCNDTLSHNTVIERCITVTGDSENNRVACRLILDKIVEDPHSDICLNVSYAEAGGPVSNSDLTSSPFTNSLNSSGSMKSVYSNSSNSSVSNVSQRVNRTDAAPFSGGKLTAVENIPFIESVARMLRAHGFVESAISDISLAVSTLESLGVLNFVLSMVSSLAIPSNYGYQMPYSPVVSAPLSAVALPEDVSLSAGSITNMEVGFDPSVANGSPMSQTPGFHFSESRYQHLFLADAEAAALDPLYSSSPTIASPAAASLPIRNTSLDWNTPFQTHFDNAPIPNNGENLIGESTQIDIGVSESIVGAILGQGGKVLVEIQQLSGANVQISKKGVFVPGTNNRIVSISGFPNAVCTAQNLIEQRITEAKLKRQQSAFGNHLTNYSLYNG